MRGNSTSIKVLRWRVILWRDKAALSHQQTISLNLMHVMGYIMQSDAGISDELRPARFPTSGACICFISLCQLFPPANLALLRHARRSEWRYIGRSFVCVNDPSKECLKVVYWLFRNGSKMAFEKRVVVVAFYAHTAAYPRVSRFAGLRGQWT